MGFRFRRSGEWLAVVLLMGSIAAASSNQKNNVRITVVVNNTAGVSSSVLSGAESQAGGIFRAAGVEIQWIECQSDAVSEDACRRVPSANQFVLHLVPTGRTSSDLVFGVAFLGQDGTGKYCNVFFDRVEEARRNRDAGLPQLLGTVVAHELGHLLLGSHAHSPAGIMRPVWDSQSLRGIAMGMFLFTREQSSLMKARFQRGLEVGSSESSAGD